MEIDFDEEEIVWMTRKRQYKASFAELCTANKLDSNFYTESINIRGVRAAPAADEVSVAHSTHLHSKFGGGSKR